MNGLIKSKRASTLLIEEVVRIFITIILLALLFGLLYKLWSVFSYDEKLEQAKESMKILINGIDKKEEQILLYAPNYESPNDQWVLIIWDIKSREIPEKCSSNSWKKCICFCDLKATIETVDYYKYKSSCDSHGICENFDNELTIKESHWIMKDNVVSMEDVPVSLNINYTKKEITRIKS